MIARTPLCYLPDQPRIDSMPDYCLHHRQMFKIIMGLKQGIAGEKFHQDASDTPDVTRETPAEVENNFRCPIMPCGDNRGVVFIVERGRTKVNEPNLTVKKNPPLTRVARICMGRRGDGTVIGEGLVGAADEEDVFGFEVGVNEIQVMKDWIRVSENRSLAGDRKSTYKPRS